jgi:hypothetical protein
MRIHIMLATPRHDIFVQRTGEILPRTTTFT